jgi:hypothetical protein
MRSVRHRFLQLGAVAAFILIGAPACDSPSAPPIEEEPKDDEEPEEGIRSRTTMFVIGGSAEL